VYALGEGCPSNNLSARANRSAAAQLQTGVCIIMCLRKYMVQLSLHMVHDCVNDHAHMHASMRALRACRWNSVWEQRHRFVARLSTQRIRKRSWDHRDPAVRGV
jgi:hypothetical protein